MQLCWWLLKLPLRLGVERVKGSVTFMVAYSGVIPAAKGKGGERLCNFDGGGGV